MTDQHTLTQHLLDDPWWGWTILTDPAWRAAWDRVPRAAYASDTWFEWNDGAWVKGDRVDNPSAWATAVHTFDEPFITQIADNKPSCSLSAPTAVAAMLAALRLEDGMRVLESGAGMGWTAALMCARLGDHNVFTVEYDPELARGAFGRLAAAGYGPGVRIGDGEAGWEQWKPFDRVSATHAVTRIPAAWIEQTTPGGLICAPLRISRNLDVLVQLTVAGDGTAAGPALFPLTFMPSRTNPPLPPAPQALGDSERTGKTDLDIGALAEHGAGFVLQITNPGLTITGPALEDGDDCVRLHHPDGSWAVGYVPTGQPWQGAVVDQYGPRDLWTGAEAAHEAWQAGGCPTLDRYGLSVDVDGEHRLWLGEPGNVVSVLSPH